MKTHFLRFGSVCVLSLAASAASANLLINGSFEDGIFVDNTGQQTMRMAGGATTMPGWTVGGDFVAWINAGNPFQVAASQGDKFLDLTDYQAGAPFGGVTQDVATGIGWEYELSFDLGSSTRYGHDVSIEAVAGPASAIYTSSSLLSGVNDWQRFTLAFTASSTLTTVSLRGARGNHYIGLDNVELRLVSAVPEPGSTALLLAGLAALGWTARGRRP